MKRLLDTEDTCAKRSDEVCELFDNEKDPQQLRSASADPAYAKAVENFKAC